MSAISMLPLLLLAVSNMVQCTIHSDRYQKACVQQETTSLRTVDARSRIQCVAKCSIDEECFWAEFQNGSCRFYQQTVANCSATVDPSRTAYVKVASSRCANGGTFDGDKCLCSPLFTGQFCQNENDLCVPNPCLNTGSCQNIPGDFNCLCPDGFSGSTCQTDMCSPEPCLNGGLCARIPGDYMCTCAVGFSGKDCEADLLCQPNPCQNLGACVRVPSSYSCDCVSGFSGTHCVTEDGPVAVPGLITVTNGLPWGSFGTTDYCLTGSFASSWMQKVDPYNDAQVSSYDDTGLSGITVTCTYPSTLAVAGTVTSSVAPFGAYASATACPTGYYMVAFKIRAQPSQGTGDSTGDDTSVNNFTFRCRGPGLDGLLTQDVEGDGESIGLYGSWSAECPAGSAICAISTRVENNQNSGDDTAMNDLQCTCCEY